MSLMRWAMVLLLAISLPCVIGIINLLAKQRWELDRKGYFGQRCGYKQKLSPDALVVKFEARAGVDEQKTILMS